MDTRTGSDVPPSGFRPGSAPVGVGRTLSPSGPGRDRPMGGREKLGGLAEHADRTGHSGPTEPAVAVGIRRQVLLVVVLGVVEGPGRRDLGCDLGEPGT